MSYARPRCPQAQPHRSSSCHYLPCCLSSSFSEQYGVQRNRGQLMIGLAVMTLLGWGLFLYAKLDDAENRRGARRDILSATANLDTLKGQLAQQEQTSGSLADLQNAILVANARLGEATQNRDQAQAQLASVQKELDAQLQLQTQAAQ